MNRVDGKIALVTGAARGIGRRASECLAEAGAIVVVTDIDEAGAAKTAEGIESAGGKALSLHHDVTYEEDMRDVLAAEPEGTFGYEDITGIPWIEIDFPSDLLRAQKIVMPLVGDFVAEETPSPEQPQVNQAPGE